MDNIGVIIWTLVFFGSDIVILIYLLYKALQADRAERTRAENEQQSA